MKRILTVLAGVSLLASFFAAAPAPVSAVAPGGWWDAPDHVVATRDLNRGPVGTCTNPDFTSIEAAVEDLDQTNESLPDSWTIGVCKGTHVLTSSIYIDYNEFTFVGQGTSNTVIDGSKISYYVDEDHGIIESAYDIAVANITFKGGHGYDGGAIHTDLDFYCVTSSFIGNHAGDEGGAVYVVGDALLERCTFRNNTAGDGGGAVYGHGSVIDYGGNYTLNSADWGGAVAQGAPIASDNTTGFYSSTFTKNSAVEGNGGAIYADDGDTFVVASRFTGNMSTDHGGAIAKQGCSESIGPGGFGEGPWGLAYLVLDKCTLEISDSNFLSNTAEGDGGAVASLDLTTGVSITGSTFQLNRADNGAAVASVGLLEAGQNLFVRNRASGVGIVTYFADSVATYCDYGFGFTDEGDEVADEFEDLDPIYIAAVIDAADRIDLSANRFSRNIGASTVNYGTGFGPVPSWVKITELQLNWYCVGGPI